MNDTPDSSTPSASQDSRSPLPSSAELKSMAKDALGHTEPLPDVDAPNDAALGKAPHHIRTADRSGFAPHFTGLMAVIGLILAVGVPVICGVIFAQLIWENAAGYRALMALVVTISLALLGIIPGTFLLREARHVYVKGPRRRGALLILLLMLPIVIYGVYVLLTWPDLRLYAVSGVVLSALASFWATFCLLGAKRFHRAKSGH